MTFLSAESVVFSIEGTARKNDEETEIVTKNLNYVDLCLKLRADIIFFEFHGRLFLQKKNDRLNLQFF